MDKEFIVKKTIALKATPAQVWEALTNPALTKKYFFGCKVHSRWMEGSDISFNRKFLWMKIELKGKIVKIEPERLLQYTLINSQDSNDQMNYSIVTDTLVYEKGITTLSIADDVGDKPGAEKRYNKSNKGWDKILSGLKDLLEEDK